MRGPATTLIVFLSAIGSGLMAGLFFIFSNTVMAALGRLPAPQGIAAMNEINAVIQNPLFLSLFMGTALLSLVLIAFAFMGWTAKPGWVIAAALLYLIGNIAVTVIVNVPMNDALAVVQPDSAEAARVWSGYLDRWVLWNHIRAVACTGAMAAFIAALM